MHYTYVCACILTYIQYMHYTYVHIYLHNIRRYAYTYVHAYLHTYNNTYVHAYLYIRTYTVEPSNADTVGTL